MNKTQAKAKAASIKTSVDDVHTAIDALPAGVGDDVKVAFNRLHAKLNGLAHRAADFFDDDISTFSGGTDKPQEQ